MKVKFLDFVVQSSKDDLVNLLEILKDVHNEDFLIDIDMTEDYRKALASGIDEKYIGVFQAQNDELFNSYVFVVIDGEAMRVANINSREFPELGKERYNKVLTTFSEFVKSHLPSDYTLTVK